MPPSGYTFYFYCEAAKLYSLPIFFIKTQDYQKPIILWCHDIPELER